MNNFINNNDLLIQLYKLINNYKKNSKILLACSGGPDSLLCFSLLLQLQHQYNISWGVIVINHKIKKETFSKEENYIKNICYKHNIPLHIKYLNEEIPDDKPRNQNLFRQYRWLKFIETSYEYGYDMVITGHNFQDNCDTFLMRIGKGTGFSGLASMKFINIMYGIGFLKPLLNISRENIEWLMKNTPYFLDGTRKLDYQRNKIRRIHSSLENCGITLDGISLTIQRHQAYIHFIENNTPNIIEGYNYIILKDFFNENIYNNNLIKYHWLYKGVQKINPQGFIDISIIDKINKILMDGYCNNNDSYEPWNREKCIYKENKTSWSQGGCWMIKKKNDLCITSQPLKSCHNFTIIIKPDEIKFCHKQLFILNKTKEPIIVMDIKQLLKKDSSLKIKYWHKPWVFHKLIILSGNTILKDFSIDILKGDNHQWHIKSIDFNTYYMVINENILK